MNLIPRTTTLAALALFAATPPVTAATLVVDDSPCTLTDAILSANADADQGTCTGSGVYGAEILTLDAEVSLIAADTVSSELREGDFAGLPTISSVILIEAGAASVIERDQSLGCVMDDPVPFRLFNITTGGELTLEGLTLRHGCAAGGGIGGAGRSGGLDVSAGNIASLDNNMSEFPKGPRKNNFGFSHPTCTTSSTRAQSREPNLWHS